MRKTVPAGLLLLVSSSLVVQVPYYGCTDGCDYLQEYVIGLPLIALGWYSDTAGGEFCAVHPEISDNMTVAMQGWSPSHCGGYVAGLVRREIAALPRKQATLEERLSVKFKALDDLIAPYGLVEGSVWKIGEDLEESRVYLEGKRRCLLTSLMVAAPRRIAEIGFNAGHSATAILTATSADLVSFDLCRWPYTRPAHDHLLKSFQDRSTLICGDSRETLSDEHGLFDAFFIDGAHTYAQALGDITNIRRMAKPGALVIVDDCSQQEQGGGMEMVSLAWRHAVAESIVEPLPETCGPDCGLCLGRFLPEGSMALNDVDSCLTAHENGEVLARCGPLNLDTCAAAQLTLRDRAARLNDKRLTDLGNRLFYTSECANLKEAETCTSLPLAFLDGKRPRRVVEIGALTLNGELAAALAGMLPPTYAHFVYDAPERLLILRHFLRKKHLHAYLVGTEVPVSTRPGSFRGRIALISEGYDLDGEDTLLASADPERLEFVLGELQKKSYSHAILAFRDAATAATVAATLDAYDATPHHAPQEDEHPHYLLLTRRR